MQELRKQIEDWTLGPVFPPLAGLVAFVLAAAASLFHPEIALTTREFLLRVAGLDLGRPAVWTIAFWMFLGALVTLAYLRLRAEGWRNVERMRTMLQAVHRSPNPNVFVDYPQIYRAAESSVAALAATADEPTERRAAALEAIRTVSARLVELARYFAQAPGSDLRARIFLIAEPDPNAPIPYPAALVEKLRFFDRVRHRLEGLRSLLYLPEELAGVVGKVEPGGIVLALPVPHAAETAHGHRIALPGAPDVLLTGRPAVYEDTRAMIAEECADLERAVRDELERYHARGGDGSDVLSTLAIRIGPEHDPVGVLEIVSDRARVLGAEPEYYTTFFALAEPLVRLLAGPVTAYEKAGRELGLLPGATRATEEEAVAAD